MFFTFLYGSNTNFNINSIHLELISSITRGSQLLHKNKITAFTPENKMLFHYVSQFRVSRGNLHLTSRASYLFDFAGTVSSISDCFCGVMLVFYVSRFLILSLFFI